MTRLVLCALLLASARGVPEMEQALASDTECADETCALNALQQKQGVVAGLTEDSAQQFQAAIDEGDTQEEKLTRQQDHQEEKNTAKEAKEGGKWGNGVFGNSNPYGQNPYGQNPYGQNPYGQNPYGQSPYGQNPYGQNPYHQQGPPPGYGGFGYNQYCNSKIESSSCLFWDCAKSRGPTSCNTTDHTCYCQPGHCSDGKGCVSMMGAPPVPGFQEYHAQPGICDTKIQGSSCMIFDCAKSRGPATCNTQDYYCHCQPGFCSDGTGCKPFHHQFR